MANRELTVFIVAGPIAFEQAQPTQPTKSGTRGFLLHWKGLQCNTPVQEAYV